MNSNKTTAVIVGILFFIATVSYITGSQMVVSAILETGVIYGEQVKIGVFFELINCIAVVGIAALLFPILRKRHEVLAFGYASSRVIEAVLLIVSSIGHLLLVGLNPGYVRSMLLGMDVFIALAMKGSDIAFQMAMLSLGIGSLLFCYILYVTKLVPRPLTILGFVGYVALIVSACLELLGCGIGEVLFVPGAIFEIVFPVWLIVKGFSEDDRVREV